MKNLTKLAIATSVLLSTSVLAASTPAPLSIEAMSKDVRTIAAENEAAVIGKVYLREAYIMSVKHETLKDGTNMYVATMGDKDEILTAKFKQLTFQSFGVYCLTSDKAEAAALKTKVLLPVSLTVKEYVPDPKWTNSMNILAACNFEEAGADGDRSARWDTPAK